jgi:hypothetical protein
MKMREIMETASVGASCAGGMAPSETSLGTVSRNGGSMLTGKYTTSSDPTPNTPTWMKKLKKKAPNVSR